VCEETGKTENKIKIFVGNRRKILGKLVFPPSLASLSLLPGSISTGGWIFVARNKFCGQSRVSYRPKPFASLNEKNKYLLLE
jgi:hypothetical protein